MTKDYELHGSKHSSNWMPILINPRKFSLTAYSKQTLKLLQLICMQAAILYGVVIHFDEGISGSQAIRTVLVDVQWYS
jgi:hypothetical protein